MQQEDDDPRVALAEMQSRARRKWLRRMALGAVALVPAAIVLVVVFWTHGFLTGLAMGGGVGTGIAIALEKRGWDPFARD